MTTRMTNQDDKALAAEATDKKRTGPFDSMSTLVKFEVYGVEMLEKEVKLSGNSGRIYLPPDWVGHRVKIIRID